MTSITNERDDEVFTSHENDHTILQEEEVVGNYKHLSAYMLIGLSVGLLFFLIIAKG